MKWIIALILALMVVGGLSVLVTSHPGFVLVKYGDWSMETTLGAFLLGLILAILVLYAGLKLLAWLLRAPSRLRAWRHHRQRRRGERGLIHGLLSFYQGNWDEAEGLLIRSAAASPSALINRLAAAHAAAAHGDTEQRDAYLREARQHAPSEEITIGLTQAQLQLDSGDHQAALVLLEQLHQLAPTHPQVLRLLGRTYRANGSWNLLLALLPQLARRKTSGKAELEQMERDAWSGMLTKAAASADAQAYGDQWNKLPRGLRKDQGMLELYARLAIRHRIALPLAPILADSIRYQWHSGLVGLYGKAEGGNLAFQIEQAEQWLHEHPGDKALALCIGRLCRRAQLWGKAKDYLKDAAAHGDRAACIELARLFDDTHDKEQALVWYRRALEA